jgi:hypothetical protein
MCNGFDENALGPEAKQGHKNAFDVMTQIALHMEFCTRAWIGLGEGKVLILKDDEKGLSTYYTYSEGCFTFYDYRGGSQVVRTDEITEIAGY